MSGSVETRTVGYMIWGVGSKQYATGSSDGFLYFMPDAGPLVFGSVGSLLAAIENKLYGPIEIHRKIETTTTTTQTEPLE